MTLSKAESHHLVHVMRAAPGDAVRVFGNGSEYEAVVRHCRSKSAVVEIVRAVTPIPGPRVAMHFAIPWLKAGRSETAVQKLTELGARSITLFTPLRSTASVPPGAMGKAERAGIEACKQCGRADPPCVRVCAGLCDAMDHSGVLPQLRIVLHPRDTGPLFTQAVREALATSADHSALFVASGPEGGFAPEEIEWIGQAAVIASLGPRILRAETAPIAAASIILSATGEM